MADDWKVGDLAVCVDARPNPRVKSGGGLVEGRVYRVTGITAPGPNTLYPNSFGLHLEGMKFNGTITGAYAAPRFRKIRPDEHEDCEPEFVELLNRIKRKVSA